MVRGGGLGWPQPLENNVTVRPVTNAVKEEIGNFMARSFVLRLGHARLESKGLLEATELRFLFFRPCDLPPYSRWRGEWEDKENEKLLFKMKKSFLCFFPDTELGHSEI